MQNYQDPLGYRGGSPTTAIANLLSVEAVL